MSLTLAVKENDGKIPYNEKSILPNMPNIEMKRTATPSIQNDQIPSWNEEYSAISPSSPSTVRLLYLKLKECLQFSLKFNPCPESWIQNFTFAPSRALPHVYVTPSCSALIMWTHWKLMSGIPRLMKIIHHGATLANTTETRFSIFIITGQGVKCKKKLRSRVSKGLEY